MDEAGAGDWSTLYIVVLAILAAIILFGVLKPMYAKGAKTVQRQIQVVGK